MNTNTSTLLLCTNSITVPSALSIEEQRLLESLDRLNEKLKSKCLHVNEKLKVSVYVLLHMIECVLNYFA